MQLMWLIKLCFQVFVRNPMRTLLTILGIVIGAAAVVAIIEIGSSMIKKVEMTISDAGGDALNIVLSDSVAVGSVHTGLGGRTTLTYGDCEAIARDCPAVEYVRPMIQAYGQVIYQHKNWMVSSIAGASIDYLKILKWDRMPHGEWFTEDYVSAARRVCLVGQTVARELFGDADPVGEQIRIKNIPFTVVGKLRKKGANMGGKDEDDIIIMPWTTLKMYLQSGSAMASVQGDAAAAAAVASSALSASTMERKDIYAQTKVQYYSSTDDQPYTAAPHPRRFDNIDAIITQVYNPKTNEAAEQMRKVLRETHHLPPEKSDDFQVLNIAEMTQMIEKTLGMIVSMLSVVAAISLVVGGVGIMNIMLVSVTERTREIGLRMAVGARPRDIRMQFLLEAVAVSLVGGLVGMTLGMAISVVVALLVGWSVQFSLMSLILPSLIAALIGVVFGWYPALRASQLSPIDALRHE